MKRTAPYVTINNDTHNTWNVHDKITCELTGEMDTGAKVWTDISTGKQYFLTRMLRKYYFFDM